MPAKTDQPNGLGPHSRNPHRYWARTAQMAQQPNPILVDKIGSCPYAALLARSASRRAGATDRPCHRADRAWHGDNRGAETA